MPEPAPTAPLRIRRFAPEDEAGVIELWQICGLTRPWNDPRRDIARKLGEQPELFLVGSFASRLVASAMIGFDGHRGWVYYLAVHPEFQRRGFAAQLMQAAEQALIARGCPKLNLMVRAGNDAVLTFYESLGYTRDDVVSLGKRLIVDEPGGDEQPGMP